MADEGPSGVEGGAGSRRVRLAVQPQDRKGVADKLLSAQSKSAAQSRRKRREDDSYSDSPTTSEGEESNSAFGGGVQDPPVRMGRYTKSAASTDEEYETVERPKPEPALLIHRAAPRPSTAPAPGRHDADEGRNSEESYAQVGNQAAGSEPPPRKQGGLPWHGERSSVRSKDGGGGGRGGGGGEGGGGNSRGSIRSMHERHGLRARSSSGGGGAGDDEWEMLDGNDAETSNFKEQERVAMMLMER